MNVEKREYGKQWCSAAMVWERSTSEGWVGEASVGGDRWAWKECKWGLSRRARSQRRQRGRHSEGDIHYHVRKDTWKIEICFEAPPTTLPGGRCSGLCGAAEPSQENWNIPSCNNFFLPCTPPEPGDQPSSGVDNFPSCVILSSWNNLW